MVARGGIEPPTQGFSSPTGGTSFACQSSGSPTI